jgi:3-phenylpropionate/cinnamic acid dioxygenase small subunit
MPTSHHQIERLLYSYAERIDAGDFSGVAKLFTNASISAPVVGSEVQGYDEVLAMYESSTQLYDNGTPCTKHVISNAIIETDEDNNRATARSYFTVYQSLPDFPLQAIIAGRYHDSFTRREGRWHFHSRIMLPELFGDLSHHLLFDADLIQ